MRFSRWGRTGLVLVAFFFLVPDTAVQPALAQSPSAESDRGLTFREAFRFYRGKAQAGDPKSQFFMGLIYERGPTGTPDLEKAAFWFEKAAAQGWRDAQYKMGTAYAQGRGVAQDWTKAAEMYRAAAEQDLPEAQYNIGVLYDQGLGVQRDHVQAADWYRRAAINGVVPALRALGSVYLKDEGIAPDRAQAFFWLTLGAAAGDKQSNELRDMVGAQLTEEEREAALKLLEDWQTQGQ